MYELERKARVLLDNQNAQAGVAIDLREHVEDLPHNHGREPERWFVKHQQARAQHEGPRDHHHMLFAAAEQAGRFTSVLGKPGKQRVHALHVLPGIGAARTRDAADEQVVLDRQPREGASAVRYVCNAEPCDGIARQPFDAPPVEGDGPVGLHHRIADGAQNRCLARPVRTEEWVMPPLSLATSNTWRGSPVARPPNFN